MKEKKKDCWFLEAMMTPIAASLIAPTASTLIKPVAFPLINSVNGKGKKQGNGFLPLLAFFLMLKVLGKGVKDREQVIITWIIWIKMFNSVPSFKQYQDY